MTGPVRAFLRSPPALVAALVVVGAFVLVLPRDGEDGPATPDPSAGPVAVMPTATPVIAASEEAFCARFRMVADLQGQYAAQPDGTGAGLLRDEVDDILTIGVPDSMGGAARTGYFLDLSGIYESLGEELDPRAVPGAAADVTGGDSLSGPAGAFGSWLSEFCPAW